MSEGWDGEESELDLEEDGELDLEDDLDLDSWDDDDAVEDDEL